MATGTLPVMKSATAEAGEPPGLAEEEERMALRKDGHLEILASSVCCPWLCSA